MIREDIRNIAIIAHVDHGKTTLVDAMLRQSGAFRQNQAVAERVMDSGDLERERGITILAKNAALTYDGIKINIVDTPGHADFGGEVERVLRMVDGVLLVVDAFEGPMPQTRFVLQRALTEKLRVVVVVNKIDRRDARCHEVVDEVLELLMDLEATDEQLDAPFVFVSAREGRAGLSPDEITGDLRPLFETIRSCVPGPRVEKDAPLKAQIATIDSSDYVGRIGIGRIVSGSIRAGEDVLITRYHREETSTVRPMALYLFDGIGRVQVEEAAAGDIVAIAGMTGVNIGDTICDAGHPDPMPFIEVMQPTMSILMRVNDSPLAGTEGVYVTSRHLRQRLYKETDSDLSLRVEDTDTTEAFLVSGRGELHLSVLIETMRRQGYEFQISKPSVILKQVDGQVQEPMERALLDVPESAMGAMIERMGQRRAELVGVGTAPGGRSRLEFSISSQALMGFRSEMLTLTRGEGLMNTAFDGYAPRQDGRTERTHGALVATESGEAVTYGLYAAQSRGELFIRPGDKVYAGMVVGENARNQDIDVNVCRKKHVTNMRASGSDEALRLTPPRPMSLEKAMEWIDDDELIEVTPTALRIRKKILNATQRLREAAKRKAPPLKAPP
ncbi:MAG: translational GTPase TypA [Christensenellales bacterium]